MAHEFSRRRFLVGGASAAAAVTLAGCNPLDDSGFAQTMQSAEKLTETTQRFFLSPTSLAREFSEADISPAFRANGTKHPGSPEYAALAAGGFADYRLKVDGLVENPAEY